MCFALVLVCSAPSRALNFTYVKDRVEVDRESGSPLVAHVTVVLCTNRTRDTDLCNENKARTNLYWGAQFGVKTYFTRQKSWQRIQIPTAKHPRVLERVAFRRTLDENNVYIVADVWRGGDVRQAITHFLTMASGAEIEKMEVDGETIYAGGEAHVMAYLGHNGLADFSLDLELDTTTSPNSAIVLGRRTAATFTQPLRDVGSFPLLTTKGVVTPEAYTLEAALISWFSTASPPEVHTAVAKTFGKFQKASEAWSKTLFVPGSMAGE